jgi:hypothetical protein
MTRRFRISRETFHDDAIAGLVLGVESVPDGLAAGLLAGVNPLSGPVGAENLIRRTEQGRCTRKKSELAERPTSRIR